MPHNIASTIQYSFINLHYNYKSKSKYVRRWSKKEEAISAKGKKIKDLGKVQIKLDELKQLTRFNFMKGLKCKFLIFKAVEKPSKI